MPPDHALQRIRPSHHCCNRGVSRGRVAELGSLGLMMPFTIFKGTVGKSDFTVPAEQDTVHGYICSSTINDRVERLASANELAKTRGLTLKTVDGPEIAVPGWRASLPTQQGRLLRETGRLGTLLILCSQSGDIWVTDEATRDA